MGDAEKISIKNFQWIENTSQFNEDFIKGSNEESDEGYFCEVQYAGKWHERHNYLSFLP